MTNKNGCQLCGGKKHVYNKKSKVWVRCQCIVDRVKRVEYKQIGVPEKHWNTDLDTLHRQSFFDDDDKDFLTTYGVGNSNAVVYWVCASSLGPKRLCTTAYAMRLFLDNKIGGVCRVSVADYIQLQFDKDNRGELRFYAEEIRHADLLVCDIDSQNHKMLSQIVLDIIAARIETPRVTLFCSSDDIRKLSGKYNNEIRSFFRSSGVRLLNKKKGAKR